MAETVIDGDVLNRARINSFECTVTQERVSDCCALKQGDGVFVYFDFHYYSVESVFENKMSYVNPNALICS